MSVTLPRPHGVRSRFRWLPLLVVLLVGLPGCASGGDRAASGQLGRLQQSLYHEAMLDFRRGEDPVQLARSATNDSGPYRVGDGQEFDQQVEALAWSSEDGSDGVVDLRLTVTTPGNRSNSIGGSSYGPGSARKCVRFHVGAANDNAVVRIRCANRPALAVPAAPEPLPPLSRSALRKAMKESSLRDAEAAARAAFPGLSVTAEVVDGSWVVVVVRERPDLACLGGTRSPRGKVVVTTVGQIRAGEADCDPLRFVRGPV